MNAHNNEDVHIGGVTGILLPTVLAGGVVMFIVAGAYGSGFVEKFAQKYPGQTHMGILDPVILIPDILGKNFGNIATIALAISAFPGACFSSFIAANSFKTTMPRVNPFLSVGLGALVSAALAVSGWAGQVERRLRGDRGLLRTGLRGDVRRLPDVPPEMVGTPRRLQPRRLDLLDRGLWRGGV